MKSLYYVLLGSAALLVISCASNKVDVDSVAGLREAKNAIEQAKKEGASEYAPATLKQAETTLDQAAKGMYKNSNMAEVEKQTNDARFAANRALVIARESKKLANLEPEKIALEKEAMFIQLRAPLQLNDMRDQQFQAQLSGLDTKIKETASLSAQTQKFKGQTEAGNKTIAVLETEKKFNERFAVASSNFNTNEAEVFRQENDLVIRIKAMDFPSGKSEIKPQNYALLNKVQKTIKVFGSPTITIEGHTDTIGSDLKNKALSLMRANAVKEYLVENNTVSADKVKTIGIGSDRPVASNETSLGRAENRRIDVIISAEVAE